MSDAGINASQTYDIVKHYVFHALDIVGIQWTRDVIPESTDSRAVMLEAGTVFSIRYAEQLETWGMGVKLNESTIYSSYANIAFELFNDDICWEKIVLFFALAGELAIKCMRDGKPWQVYFVTDFTAFFINEKILDWINKNGSWNSIIQWYEDLYKNDDPPPPATPPPK